MNPSTDFAAMLERAHAVLLNRTASVAQLRDAAERARGVVRGIDTESDLAPEREARVLAAMTGTSIAETIKALRKLDDEMSNCALIRKAGIALVDHLEERAREIEAREAAKPPEEVRREQEHARLEAQREALFARVPTLFRTDYTVSKLGAAACSRLPRPQGSHVAYMRDFTVPRVLQHLMTATKVQGWPPRHGDFVRIEWPNSEIEEDETIVGPLRLLCEKNSPSDAEVSLAIDRAQATLLNEFGRVCAEIRQHYPDGLPWFIVLPSLATPRMAAE